MPPLSYDVTCYGDDLSSSSQHTTTNTGIASTPSTKPLAEQLASTTITNQTQSPKSSSQIKKSVSFYGSVRVKKTIHINDYTQDEIDATWYNEMEVATIRFNTKLVVKEMESKCGLQHPEEETTRGLECRTTLGQKRKFTLRRMSQLVVLDEQDRQFEMGDFDPEYLSLLYKQCCEQSVAEARRIGQQDELSSLR